MKMMLAENIRTFRKERSLTQEQLAEALGVTAGAVYKWEANAWSREPNLSSSSAKAFRSKSSVRGLSSSMGI